MTAPQPQPQPQVQSRGAGILPFIVILATITMLTARWSGYAALPFVMIFAPLLGYIAVLALGLALMVVAAILAAVVKKDA